MYSYTYRIDFADGSYYFGKKKLDGNPETDGYFGSPKTNRDKWDEICCKTVLFLHEDDKDALLTESLLIGDRYKTDPKCLNRHNRDNFSTAGLKMSETTRRRMSVSHKGVSKTEEHKRRIGESNRGKGRPKELRQQISDKMHIPLDNWEEIKDLYLNGASINSLSVKYNTTFKRIKKHLIREHLL